MPAVTIHSSNAWLRFRETAGFARQTNSKLRIGPVRTRAGAINAPIRRCCFSPVEIATNKSGHYPRSLSDAGWAATVGITTLTTLNLKQSATCVCLGAAFAFADDDSKSQDLLNCLTKREACQPHSLAIRLLDGHDVKALVYIYEGQNILDPTTSLAEKASMVVRAKGKSGACIDYVRQTFEGLSSIGLNDPEVTSLWEAVRNNLVGQTDMISGLE
jgi:hypothetical protein